jgi:hypothetical protein
VNRGGSWNNNANNCKVANRNNNNPGNSNNNIGFRLVVPQLKRYGRKATREQAGFLHPACVGSNISIATTLLVGSPKAGLFFMLLGIQKVQPYFVI